MSLSIDYEKTASHISDYIENGKLFDIFEIEDIEQIMKYSKLTTEQYITLLKESPSTIDAIKIYIYTRNTTVSIQNYDEVVTILKYAKKYMKLNIFDGILDVLNHQKKEIRDSREENRKLREELKSLQNQVQNASKEMKVKQINEILSKIAELKNSGDFESVYKFLDGLSEKGNQEMMSKACREGLWEKTKGYGENVLHVACKEGNLRLVKSLIECNCNKEANDNYGWTPLIWASRNGHLAVVQYLISAGANKDAKNNSGGTALSYAKGEVRDYLKSIGTK